MLTSLRQMRLEILILSQPKMNWGQKGYALGCSHDRVLCRQKAGLQMRLHHVKGHNMGKNPKTKSGYLPSELLGFPPNIHRFSKV